MIEVYNNFDELCNFCIAIMYAMSDITGLTYGTINVLLFIILGPLSTILYAISALLRMLNKGKNFSKFLFFVATLIVLGVCGIIAFTTLCAISVDLGEML